jgi:hypothetical protein
MVTREMSRLSDFAALSNFAGSVALAAPFESASASLSVFVAAESP